MQIKLKDDSVSIKNLDPGLMLALPDIKSVFDFFGVHTVITSGCEKETVHMETSLHYKHKALDFRSRNIKPQYRDTAVRMFQFKLGGDFDVVLESNHFHIEHDPKKV